MLTPPSAVEAVLFAAGGPLPKAQAAKLLELSDAEFDTALEALADQLAGRGLSIVETKHEVELRTNADAAAIVKRLRESELARDLGKASLETLAVIAYRDGATRSEIDWVRGVNSSASLRTLLLRGLVEGSEDAHDRRRVRYALTVDALGYLGIRRASDLPRYDELGPAAERIAAESEDAAAAA